MKRALILNDLVVDVVNDEESQFPVSQEMTWVDCPDECENGWIIHEGNVVEKTPDEIAAEAQAEIEAVTNHIKIYRDERAESFVYKNTTMRLTDGARADLSAVYFSVILNTSISDTTVVMVWQEPDQDPLNITAGDMRADGVTFMNHRQKCFAAASAVKTTHDATPFANIQDIETAFETAYNS